MSELIPVTTDERGDQVVSGRTLHAFLEVSTAYKDWMPRMIAYGFNEWQDFCSILRESTGGRPSIDHALSIDMAKQLCMIQRTPLGKQAREYFIEVEKQYRAGGVQRALPASYADALRELATEVEAHEVTKAELKAVEPKRIFAEAVAASEGTILVGELAKILRGNGIEMGQNRLFAWLREWGYLIRRNGSDRNMPTQRSMEMGLFVIKETAITHSDGHVTISKTPKVTGKGQQYFVNAFLSKAVA